MGKANARNKAKRKKLTELTALHKKMNKCKDESDKNSIRMKINSIKSKL
jgi:hypothetical protein|tara:strand:- start:244 stop:390 length:147 start_codon:yes stop_codon:yes gene_type:complete